MSIGQPYQAYQKSQIETMSQEKLVLMLYEGIIRFARRAEEALVEDDLEKANHNLVRTQDIIAELLVNVNREVGEIGENLYSLYDYMLRTLIQANIKKDRSKIKEVLELAQELRDTWREVIRLNISHDYRTNKVTVSG